MDFVTVPTWSRFHWLQHGFSLRPGGTSTVYGGTSLNLGWTKEDDPALVVENRAGFVSAVSAGAATLRAMTLRQVHGTGIHVVREGDEPFETSEGRALFEGDGLITDQPGRLLGIQTADCVPIIIIDPVKPAVGVFHAGWRGTVASIVDAGVAKLSAAYGSRPEDLLAAVGPSIGACCYAVGDEVRSSGRRIAGSLSMLGCCPHMSLLFVNALAVLAMRRENAGTSPIGSIRA